MQTARALRDKLAAGSTVIGMLVTDHLWPQVLEVALDAGLDYFVIDCEHGPHSEEMVAQVCAAGRLAGFAVLVRPVSNDFRTVAKTLDLGPCGLVLAAVEDTATLDVVRDAVWLPPRGKRRPGGPGNRWVKDYHYATWKSGVEDDVIVIPQIETRTGLANVERIAAHEVVTAIGIGPYDLMVALGADLNREQPEFAAAYRRIAAAGRAAGKPFWTVGNAARLAQQGERFLCMGDPIGAMTAALGEQVKQARGNVKKSE